MIATTGRKAVSTIRKETDDVRIIWEKEGKATSGDSRSECQGKPDGWDELTRLGFEPVFVNHRPRPNGISGDYVQTRWRLKANPDVTCTVYDSWEGGGGATFLDFDA